jgi:hypothetical protein
MFNQGMKLPSMKYLNKTYDTSSTSRYPLVKNIPTWKIYPVLLSFPCYSVIRSKNSICVNVTCSETFYMFAHKFLTSSPAAHILPVSRSHPLLLFPVDSIKPKYAGFRFAVSLHLFIPESLFTNFSLTYCSDCKMILIIRFEDFSSCEMFEI